MRWLIAVVVGVIALIAIVFAVVPAAGGPEPGRVISKPTVDECRERRLGSAPGAPGRGIEEVTVRWIWSSDRYGWGCHYRFADGSTGVLVTGS